jgi:4-hydroxy-3-polyprenylbenzoate decarboxylase
MTFPALGEFLGHLDSIGELKRIKVPVDSKLEVTEIAVRTLKEGKPALLFENVIGSTFPLAINVYASEKRIERALGKHPEQIGEELISFFESMMPPNPRSLWRQRKFLWRLIRSRGKSVQGGSSQEIVEVPDLDTLPIQICWPKDGGRFVTQGQVFSYDPKDGRRNVGMYRLQVYDHQTTGMHIQIERGGGFHLFRAEQLNQDLPVAVALGTDPALLLATVAALPEGLDEVTFASFLRGAAIPMVRGKVVHSYVPANAEFVLEGIVPAHQRRMEGPFGDHFGHYSSVAPFPEFHLKTITHRRNAIYPATIVGVPPMEDKFVGDATQEILGPLVKLLHKEIDEVWAYYEAGFHNLLVVSVEERYKKEAMKAALGLLGTGQLSLTKCLVLVSKGVEVRNWDAVLREIGEHFDPHFDFVLIPKVSQDTLDFTSYKMELGSKMVVDATQKKRSRPRKSTRRIDSGEVRRMDRRILDASIREDVLLTVKVSRDGRAVVEKLVRRKELAQFKMLVAVSDDVDIHDRENLIWGTFSRFDCERDLTFSEQQLIGISPIYKGVMGIDATWKKGYPEPLVMDPAIVKKVNNRWESYWH